MTKFVAAEKCTLRNGEQVGSQRVLISEDIIASIDVSDQAPHMVRLKPEYEVVDSDMSYSKIEFDYWITAEGLRVLLGGKTDYQDDLPPIDVEAIRRAADEAIKHHGKPVGR